MRAYGQDSDKVAAYLLKICIARAYELRERRNFAWK